MGKRSTKSVAEEIYAVEGFEVHFISDDPKSAAYVDRYPYERAATSGWTVKKWRDRRWMPNYPGYEVEVLNPNGDPSAGRRSSQP